MNWLEFDKKIKAGRVLLFTPEDVRKIFGVSKRTAIKFLGRHAQKGGVARVKRGLYALSSQPIPSLYIANKLYEPSYLSLEFALSFHSVRPETVYVVTSVTTKKTKQFEALGYLFLYRQIKKKAFTGYKAISYQGTTILMAEPEKALVDHLYLKILGGGNLKDIADNEFERLNREKINNSKVLDYARLFDDNKLVSLLEERLR